MKSIPNCIPYIAGNEMENLKSCIQTGWISPVGPFVDEFENEFASYHDVEKAAAVSSGTAALHLGLKVLGVKPGDLVLCPTLTFIGTINPIKYLGAEPLFLGVENKTLNIDVPCLKQFLKTETFMDKDSLIYKKDGRRISALIVVHLYGNPADMDPILEISEQYRLPVLEDAAESLGARYKGELVGTLGDVGCFSFNGNKVITSGGGGMIIATDPEKTMLCKHLSTQAKADNFEFLHDAIGFNYRLSNLCAAVGVAQLEHLDTFITEKRSHADRYKSLFSKSHTIEVVSSPSNCYGTYWMVLAKLKYYETGNIDCLGKLRLLSKSGIGVRPVWYPIHLLHLYKDAISYGCENSGQIYNSTFCLPSSVGLKKSEIKHVAEKIIKLF